MKVFTFHETHILSLLIPSTNLLSIVYEVIRGSLSWTDWSFHFENHVTRWQTWSQKGVWGTSRYRHETKSPYLKSFM